MKKSEIRKHYFQDKYVIISPKRGQRPHIVKVCAEDTSKTPECFMCPGGKVNLVYEIPDLKGGWLIRVIKNLYPALSPDNKYAYGRQEIIIESPDHKKEIHELSTEHIKKVLDVYSERYESLIKMKKIRYVLVFKNEGGKAGESIDHAHSQIIALPMVPPLIREEINAVDNYQIENQSCPYCDIIKNEKKSVRVAWEDKNIFVLCPYASEFPYEAWFMPKKHLSSLHDMNRDEKHSLAEAMKHIIEKVESIGLSYNYFFHNSVDDCGHHMILKLEPRPNVWAGLELGTGVIINSVPPEDAAKFYKAKVKPKKVAVGK